jgi:hypothetical protein
VTQGALIALTTVHLSRITRDAQLPRVTLSVKRIQKKLVEDVIPQEDKSHAMKKTFIFQGSTPFYNCKSQE